MTKEQLMTIIEYEFDHNGEIALDDILNFAEAILRMLEIKLDGVES